MESPSSLNPTVPGQANILVVDDQAANRLSLRTILEGLGQKLVEAHSGDEALRQLLQTDFAVVLLDLEMPGLDGFETAKLIRARDKTRRTPIIFLTAHDDDRFPVERAYELGAVDYLTKPLVPVILRAKVAGFVELFKKTEQVRSQAEQLRQMERREFVQKLAEENIRLKESEARKTAILETALDCIITIDHHGRIVEFNPAAERTFGYSGASVLGRKIGELIVPLSLPAAHSQGLADYPATGQASVLGKLVEMPALRADGTEFPAELSIARIASDGPPMFTAHLRDITERTRLDRHRNARLAVTQVIAFAKTVNEAARGILQAVCESLGWDVGLFWVLARDSESLRCTEIWRQPDIDTTQFEAVSRQRMFRLNEGLPGRVWASAKPVGILDVVNDPNFPRAPAAAQAGLHGAFACPILLGGETLGVIEFFSRQIRMPDVELHEMMASVGVQIGHFMERRWAEDQLRQSEQRFARFMEHLPGLAWIKDLEGRYVYANTSATTAFRKPLVELYGKTDDEVFDRDTAQRFKENDQRALASGGVNVIETLEHADGVVHHSLVSKFPILGPGAEPSLVGGMAIDITDRIMAEKALKEADRRKDEFLATLAHELRNPLAPICNSLQILKLPRLDSATVERTREMMDRQVQHLVRMVDDLLDVSRVMRGKIEPRKEQVELASVVARAVETAQPLIDSQGHELTIDLPSQPLLLNADPVRLSQVISNLLTNAAKYTDPKGRIELTAIQEGDQAVLSVRDNGIGIEADLLPHVFDLFVQGDNSTARSRGGLGIGLTLVKSLVEMHDGAVEVQSGGLGKGSQFLIRLPLCRPPVASAMPEVIAKKPLSAEGACHRLLVVDDNKDAAESLAALLRWQGHQVQVAYDGPSALEQAKCFQPEVVFLDIGMPGMDGYEVARRLRQVPGLKNVVIAAVTGWGQQEDRRRSADAGFDHHLVKPPEPQEIQNVLTQLGLPIRKQQRRP